MDKLYYKEYDKLEREHWWFRARLEILELFTRKLISKLKNNPKVLNAGAGTGATSVMLKKYGNVSSLEYDKDCAEYLSEILDENVLNNSLTDLPFDQQSFDLVCAFDVIEHIENHEKAIKESNRVLSKDGYIFLTVPAFNILWSRHDDINHHFRRYRLSELERILKENGFEIEYCSYFNFFLFPLVFLFRTFSKLLPNKKSDGSTGSDFEKFNFRFLNKLLYTFFISESALLNREMKLPFGVSAMIIGKKVAIE